jgi:hypothetical protein
VFSALSPSRIAAPPALVLLLLLVIAAAFPHAAPAKAKPKCPKGGVTLVKSSKARVYQVHVNGETRTYGCWISTGARLRLDERCDPDDGSPSGDDACTDDPDDYALNGKYVALATSSLYYGESGNTYMKIVRARLGSKPAVEDVARVVERRGEEYGPFVTKLFVSARGGIAYSATGVSEDLDDDVSTIGYVAPGDDTDEVLDAGAKIDAASLAVSGATMTWTNDKAPKSAPFN